MSEKDVKDDVCTCIQFKMVKNSYIYETHTVQLCLSLCFCQNICLNKRVSKLNFFNIFSTSYRMLTFPFTSTYVVGTTFT